MLMMEGQGHVTSCVLLVTFTILSWLRTCTCEPIVTIPPVLTRHPPSQVIYVLHHQVSLPCHADGSPSPSYYWTKDGMILDIDDGQYDVREGSLYISEADQQYQGIYYCWAHNQGGTDRSPPVNLTMAFLKSFLSEPEYRQMALGTSVLLTCDPPAAVPPPNITWYIRDAQQQQTQVVFSDNIILDLDNNLHILSFGASDAGEYACVAKNPVSRSLVLGAPITLSVDMSQDTPPGDVKFRWKTPSTVTVFAGSILRIQCIFSGDPPPIITWQKVNADMPAGRWSTTQGGSTLVIRDANITDAGIYECVAFNELSLDPLQRNINVIVQDTPYFMKTPASLNVTAGENVTLECMGKGTPLPTITWSINWHRVVREVESDDSNIYVTDKSYSDAVGQTIYVRRALPDDTMVLGCVASNQHGEVYHSSYFNVIGGIQHVVGSSGWRTLSMLHQTHFIMYSIIVQHYIY